PPIPPIPPDLARASLETVTSVATVSARPASILEWIVMVISHQEHHRSSMVGDLPKVAPAGCDGSHIKYGLISAINALSTERMMLQTLASSDRLMWTLAG